MWSWIGIGLTAWFSLAVMTGLAIGRAVRLRDLIGAPAFITDSGLLVGQPETASARGYVRR